MSRSGPAYRIETPRLVIRCWEPGDASLMHQAIEESRPHLRPWMPWANEEPKSMESRVDLLRRFRGEFDLGLDYTYGIFDRQETRVLGGTGLHTRRGETTREIGYWIHADHVNQGLATESTSALIRVAFEVDEIARVEIRCDPQNLPSAAIPKKLGFTREGILRKNSDFMGSRRDTEVWSLISDEYAVSPAMHARIQAWNVLGQKVLG